MVRSRTSIAVSAALPRLATRSVAAAAFEEPRMLPMAVERPGCVGHGLLVRGGRREALRIWIMAAN